MNIKLKIPLKHIIVTQPFGVNFVDFYTKLNMKGHNGIDFLAKTGTPCYASHNGMVKWSGMDSGGGISITLWNNKELYSTIYYHLQKTIVKEGQYVKTGDLIGYCDNTGQYTTGDHLHFGLKKTDDIGNTKNYQNGYAGAIDPTPYFEKGWDLFPVLRGYGQIKFGWNSGKKWIEEIKAKNYLSTLWKRKAWSPEVMAFVYGDWRPEFIKNPLNNYIWGFQTREEYERGDFLGLYSIPLKII